MTTKKFSLGNQQQMEQKFIEFEGIDEDGETVDFKFEIKKMINGTVLTGAIVRGGQSAVAEVAELVPFIRRCIKSTDQEAFDKMIDDESVGIPSKTLGEVWNYLVEVYSGRPLEQQSASSPGQQTAPNTSTVTSTSAE